MVVLDVVILAVLDAVDVGAAELGVDEAAAEHVDLGQDEEDEQSLLDPRDPVHPGKGDDEEEEQGWGAEDPDIVGPTAGHLALVLDNA